MNANDFGYGFRALGRDAERKIINWQSAFRSHVEADPRATTEGECFLSVFMFGDAFRQHLETTGSTKGYAGPTFAEWISFDIDRADDLNAALADVRRLAATLEMRLGIDPEQILSFFSGSKGFHLLLPSAVCGATPAAEFHTYCRAFCSTLADEAGVAIDLGVYARVNLFRAANSRHRKTGLYKTQLTPGELFGLKPEAVVSLAREQREGYLPKPADVSSAAAELWQAVTTEADSALSEAVDRRQTRAGKSKLNPTTRAVLAEGSFTGDRHRELFSAAADMAEFSSIDELIHALLTKPGLDSGLSVSEVSRQICCGIQHGGRSHG